MKDRVEKQKKHQNLISTIEGNFWLNEEMVIIENTIWYIIQQPNI